MHCLNPAEVYKNPLKQSILINELRTGMSGWYRRNLGRFSPAPCSLSSSFLTKGLCSLSCSKLYDNESSFSSLQDQNGYDNLAAAYSSSDNLSRRILIGGYSSPPRTHRRILFFAAYSSQERFLFRQLLSWANPSPPRTHRRVLIAAYSSPGSERLGQLSRAAYSSSDNLSRRVLIAGYSYSSPGIKLQGSDPHPVARWVSELGDLGRQALHLLHPLVCSAMACFGVAAIAVSPTFRTLGTRVQFVVLFSLGMYAVLSGCIAFGTWKTNRAVNTGTRVNRVLVNIFRLVTLAIVVWIASVVLFAKDYLLALGVGALAIQSQYMSHHQGYNLASHNIVIGMLSIGAMVAIRELVTLAIVVWIASVVLFAKDYPLALGAGALAIQSQYMSHHQGYNLASRNIVIGMLSIGAMVAIREFNKVILGMFMLGIATILCSCN
ncbi:hypothetical protein HID58_089139 [Brassica napus]|uniref:Uncharacterized protein n=1 Tax=Brassica napus TaxID=3708 RepID=A0ABQ7Y0N3_BRANA|nr:hypothetical protein HID58_089139 [Brassica napus]